MAAWPMTLGGKPRFSPSTLFSAACTDKELRSLASRLKDWFGALHEDANRVIKPTSSDTTQGSKTTLFLLFHYKYSNAVGLAAAYFG